MVLKLATNSILPSRIDSLVILGSLILQKVVFFLLFSGLIKLSLIFVAFFTGALEMKSLNGGSNGFFGLSVLVAGDLFVVVESVFVCGDSLVVVVVVIFVVVVFVTFAVFVVVVPSSYVVESSDSGVWSFAALFFETDSSNLFQGAPKMS